MDTTLTNCQFSISDPEQTKNKVLNYANKFSTFCFLDNHQYHLPHHSVECILAAGVKRSVKAQAGNALKQLQSFIDEKSCWLFGHLGYDLKNEIEELHSSHPDPVGFEDLFFFEPEVLVVLNEKHIRIEAPDAASVWKEIQDDVPVSSIVPTTPVMQPRLSRQQYVDLIKKLKEHIHRGDCYEINFCQEFFAEGVIDPVNVYKELSRISPNPFSAFYRNEDHWLACASPERFLKKQGKRILSQPIKGTGKRNTPHSTGDEEERNALSASSKDRSENVMVVDLVRNDLSRVCEDSSVKVDELFGIYSFPQVHQMISTVSGVLRENVSFAEIIRACFPMGSMTGAPKKRVMELIEQYENTRRGIFSGAVGYIDPDGNFDLNVVIRSIMYNSSSHYISIQAGSGITFYSDPEKEWEECLMKGEAMMRSVVKG